MKARNTAQRIAILGAGPIGLEAALYAAQLQLPFRVFERAEIGANLRRWGHVRLFTPFGMNSSSVGRAILRAEHPRSKLPGEQDLLSGREHVTAYLEPLANSSLLAGTIEPGTTALALGRKGFLREELPGDARRAVQPFRLLVSDPNGKERIEEYEVVLDCTGTYGNGRALGEGGIPAVGELAAAPQIARGLEDILGERASHYADRTVLVLGSGYSAATSVVLLAQLAQKHPSTWIIWLARRSGSQPIRRFMNDSLRERDLLAGRANSLATRGEGHVEFHPNAQVESVEPQGKEGILVKARVGSQERTWNVDRVIANVGYEPDERLSRELPENEPNYFTLGMRSQGRSSQFLLQEGFDQVRAVFARLTGRSDLNLYRSTR